MTEVCDPDSPIEIFAIGGQKPHEDAPSGCASSPSLEDFPCLGTLEEEEIIRKMPEAVGFLFNYSNSEYDPLHLVLTPTKIFVSKNKNPIFQSTPANESVGDPFPVVPTLSSG
jgi:hypothetical protein